MRIKLLAVIVCFVISCSGEDESPCDSLYTTSCFCGAGQRGTVDCSGACVCRASDMGDRSDQAGGDDSGIALDLSGGPDATDDMNTSDMRLDTGERDMTTEPRPGDCQSDADCPNGVCRPIADAARSWHVCVTPVEDPATCDESELSLDECCNSNECSELSGGQCVRGPVFYCGGAAPIPANLCTYGECTTDADCDAEGTGVCVDAGAWGEPNDRCVYGDCRVDADCASRTGGECRPFFGACRSRFVGLFCTYDDSTCRVDSDCPQSGAMGEPYCAPGDDGTTSCETFLPPP